MSRYKFDWWPQAIWAVRNYPARKDEYEEMQEQSLSQKLTGMPGGIGVTRAVENIALKQMAPQKQREYEAVKRAIDTTMKLEYGQKRKDLIEMVYWKGGKLPITQVMYQVNAGDALAKRWHREFIFLVGKNIGYIREVDPSEPK